MNYWLDAEPEDILEEVILARQLAGEDLDETSAAVRRMVVADIVSAQKDIRRTCSEADGQIRVFRSIKVLPSEVDDFETRGLGTCWAFTRAGAHAYEGRSTGTEVIMEARVGTDDVMWPMVIGMWSSGEGEARLDRRAIVVLDSVSAADGTPLRSELWGAELSLDSPEVGVAKP
ncbi:hypothetical protein G6L37_05190 [Agrobacterium rubi]|nr:hypothetical protein [Agrobacterium rubi]NTF24751.1 hypothetical protein [Agrobacterium rubi]